MSLRTRLSDRAVNVEASVLSVLLDGGYLRIYGGYQPETADTEITDQILLSEMRFANPAFMPAVQGVVTANSLAKDLMANATGKATWYRCFERDGETVIMDGSVGEKGSGMNLELNSVEIQAGAEVSIDFFQHRIPKG